MTKTRTHPLGSLLIFMVAVFLGGAMLAPWIYWRVHALVPDSHIPFHRFESRAFLSLALIGIWPLLRSLGVDSWRAVGFANFRGQWHRILSGFLLGFASFAIVAATTLLAHRRQINPELTPVLWFGAFGVAAATALVVSALEELLFRGAIFGALRLVWNWRTALAVSSMIYALVHFMEKAEIQGPVTWLSGLQLLPRMLRGFVDLRTIIPGFFNLTLVGVMLGLAYQRTGNLFFSIGLHAGWIFWLTFFGLATNPVDGGQAWLWGTQKLINGCLALVVLALTLFAQTKLSDANKRDATKAT